MRPGQVYGESDRYGAYPQKNAVHPYDLISSVYHALGISHDSEFHDRERRPHRISDGRPVLGLFGG